MLRRSNLDYQEPEPSGRWLEPDNTVARRRAERAFSVAGILLGVAVTIAGLFLVLNPETRPTEGLIASLYGIGAFAFGGLTYIIVHTLGLALTAVSWRDFGHDLRLRGVWVVVLEATLFFAAAIMVAYSLIDAVRNQSLYSACVFALLACMSFWPLIRHRLRHGHWPHGN